MLRGKLAVLAMLVVIALCVPQAFATVQVRISNPGFGDTGWISCATSFCSFVGAVGNYTLTSNIATSSNSINPLLDMAYSARTESANAGSLIIEAIADGYTLDTPSFEFVADGNGTINSNSITVGAYGGASNATCALNTCHATDLATIASSTFGNPPNSYHFDGTGPGNTVNPYSLGLSYTILSPTTAGSLSGDLQLNAVPEPASLALLGTGLVGLAGTIRRKLMR